ncbi:hypothetical protein O1611_g873 [Lasiodiplodia mahajangana]|uniref:Uncharacterized protein n=1 Tax=Lasiodiplodia mahajangana TaxID=1108764 RepID=A0ACC2JZ48_9PEZI|nr:hypothetical protein O1611_g873 [Lasiodiplodia mahajangana]
MPDRSIYTIGWVCAVNTELIPARAFLDEKHEGIGFKYAHDNNTYVLGRIKYHNVVIASLPDGTYGEVAAANVARDMIRSFPNIRIGLMVGIGGGVPTNHDIRLGDVVVSRPGDGSSGVFQYDYGQTIQDQAFVYTGVLNKPPDSVMTAVNILQSIHKTEGHQLNEAIASILDRHPMLRDEFQRPAAGTDRLYRSDVVHAAKDGNCELFCGDESKLVFRNAQSPRQRNPEIHYGIIASGNQVMKNALIRDQLSKEKDVLCFEMEASGLMNQFPFLVVRGICDYSDSHKNSLWQGYAAMAAAAYTKELLYHIDAEVVEVERRLGQLFIQLQENTKQIKTTVETTREENHANSIYDWLSPPDPSTNLNNALDNNRHPGSGEWLLNHVSYTSWKKEESSFLWLCGITGCGKTVLASTIIENLQKDEMSCGPLLYFYFDFSDAKKQSLHMMLLSMVSQLYLKRQDTRGPLDELYSQENRQKPSLKKLREIFLDMVQQAGGEVWIVLDAVDECTTRRDPIGGLLLWIQSLPDSQINAHLLVTSRPEPDINAFIGSWTANPRIIHIESMVIKDDISAYVRACVRDSSGPMKRWCEEPEIQGNIENTLIQKANGMFRWVSCQLDELAECLNAREVREALKNLPRTLDETYDRMIEKIDPKRKSSAVRLLQFLAFSEKPLELEEVVDIIAVETNGSMFKPKDRLPIPDEILKYCPSLVIKVETNVINSPRIEDQSLVTTKKHIQLSHFSVKEYLVSSRPKPDIARNFETTLAKVSLAEVCLNYLLGLEYNQTNEELHRHYPFALHATKHWANYAVAAESNAPPTLSDLIVKFLGNSTAFRACYEKLYDTTKGLKTLLPLFYAASVGLGHVVRLLLDNGADPNAIGQRSEHYESTVLHAASSSGHGAIVEMLLNRGAEVNARNGDLSTALHAASSSGHEAVVKLLLESGAEVNARNGVDLTALHVASTWGHEEVVKLLLENGAEVNAQNREDVTALHLASNAGHETVVRILINSNADINAECTTYGTALGAAATEGHEEVMRVLVTKGASMTIVAGPHGDLLNTAASFGNGKVVKLLLELGADVNGKNEFYRSHLSEALYKLNARVSPCQNPEDQLEYGEVIELLLDRGAIVTDSDRELIDKFASCLENGEKILSILQHRYANVGNTTLPRRRKRDCEESAGESSSKRQRSPYI